MARRQRNTENGNTTTTESEESTVTTSTEEAPVEVNEEAATEVPVEETEAAVEATVEASAEERESDGSEFRDDEPAAAAEAPAPEADLTDFKAAIQAAIEGHDNATGTVPEALVAPVTEQYRKIDGLKGKNAAKKFVEEAMREGMASMDIGLARAYMVLSDNLTAGATAKQDKAPADPTEALVQRVAGLELARALVVVPEGVKAGWEDQVEELIKSAREAAEGYQAWLLNTAEDKGDEPEAPGWAKASVKLAQGKSAKVGGSSSSSTGTRAEYTGERRDIGKHIAEAFADQPSGTFLSIAEIRSFKSKEYGDNPPSAGAISARLFPQGDASKCTLDFVSPGHGGEKGNKGATKK